jgi:YVTN family beta-propeller protein
MSYNALVSLSTNSQGLGGIGGTSGFPISNFVSPKLPDTSIRDVAIGNNHSLFLMNNGHVYACGSNTYGQLGIGSTSSRNIPVLAFSGQTSTCVSIAAGIFSSYAITADGKLYGWGANSAGQLGLGDVVDRTSPTRIGTASNWVKVVASPGGYHVIALNSNGQIYGFGRNINGQLGQDFPSTQILNVTRIGVDSWWTDIAVNDTATYALKNDGTVYACGSDSSGGQGNGSVTGDKLVLTQIPSLSNITKLFSCGANIGAALSGTNLYVWGGSNSNLVLRTGSNANLTSPTLISSQCKFFAANNIFSVLIATDGRVYGAGSSAGDYLGRGTSSIDAATPLDDISGAIKASISITGALILTSIDKKLYSIGADNGTTSGASITSPSYYGYPWIALPNNNIKQIVVNKRAINDILSSNFKIVLTSDNTLYGWGSNVVGVLGENIQQASQNIKTKLTSGYLLNKTWKKIACGHAHSAFLATDGTLRLFSEASNSYNQIGAVIGYGYNTAVASPALVCNDVACGGYITVVIASNNRLYGCGVNNKGQVGVGGVSTSVSTFTQLATAVSFSKVACGTESSLALSLDGQVYSWGDNTYGQLGSTSNTIWSPSPINLSGTYTEIACGDYHSVFLKSDGTLWGCGLNNVGQLGVTQTIQSSISTPVQLSPSSNWIKVFAFGNNTVAINNLGQIYVCGDNSFGQISTGSNSPSYFSSFTLIPELYVANPLTDTISFDGDTSSWFGTAYALTGEATTTTTTAGPGTTTTVGPGTTTTVGPGTTTTVGPGTTTTTTTTAAPVKPAHAYVSNYNSETISVIEVSTGNLISTINLNDPPSRSFIDSTSNAAYVLQSTPSRGPAESAITIINTNNSSIRSTINLPIGFNATWISVDNINKKAYITSNSSASILVLNTITDSIEEVLTYPTNIRSTLIYNGIMYCAENPSNTLGVFNLSSKTRTTTIPVGSFPYGIAIDASSNKLYVSNFNSNSISVINTLTNAIVSTISGVSKPIQLAINTSTQRLYALNSSSAGAVVVINTNDNSIITNIAVGKYPQSIALDSTYNKALVTSGEDDQVKILNLANNTVSGTLNVGDNPIYVSIGGILFSNTTTTTTTTTLSPGTTTTTTTTTVDPTSICKPNKQFLRIQLRRGTDQEFTVANLVLASGEPAYALDTNILKIGDGVSDWTELSPIGVDMSNETDVYAELQDILVGGNRISFNYDNNLQKISINAALEPQVFNRQDFDISTNQNNFNLGTSAVVKIIPSGNVNITGILAGQNNEIKLVYNGGANNVTMVHNSSSSSVGNRIFNYTKQNFILSPDHGVTIIYDSAIQSWRLF